MPYSKIAVWTTARIAAFNPGQSPPPVTNPIFFTFFIVSLVLDGERLERAQESDFVVMNIDDRVGAHLFAGFDHPLDRSIVRPAPPFDLSQIIERLGEGSARPD